MATAIRQATSADRLGRADARVGAAGCVAERFVFFAQCHGKAQERAGRDHRAQDEQRRVPVESLRS